MKKIEIITDKETLEQFINRQDIEVLDIDIRATEQSAFCQQYFVAVVSSAEWVKVDDALPEKEHTDVLVCYYANKDSKFFPEARYIKQSCWYDDVFECEEEVTHWKPLDFPDD